VHGRLILSQAKDWMTSTTIKNLLLAASLSLTLTLSFGVLYVFYPLILAWLSAWLDSSGTGGSIAVGFVASRSFINVLFLIALVLFLIIFGLLQRRQIKG
jgi:uncharacterized membrane protein (DUF485 family)